MRRNPGLPPPHVMEALRHVDWYKISRLKTTHHLRECPRHPNIVEEPCCQPWETAHLFGTCCEGYSWLIAYDMPWPPGSPPDSSTGKPVIGTDLPAVRFCPWCGARKLKKRKQRRKAGRLK